VAETRERDKERGAGKERALSSCMRPPEGGREGGRGARGKAHAAATDLQHHSLLQLVLEPEGGVLAQAQRLPRPLHRLPCVFTDVFTDVFVHRKSESVANAKTQGPVRRKAALLKRANARPRDARCPTRGTHESQLRLLRVKTQGGNGAQRRATARKDARRHATARNDTQRRTTRASTSANTQFWQWGVEVAAVRWRGRVKAREGGSG